MERQWDDFRIFLEVARSRSATTAARSLKVSVATVRRRIGALEHTLGVQLFDRADGLFVPTIAALNLMPAVESMESVSQAAVEKLKNSDARIAGVVRIGAPDGISTVLLAPLLTELQLMHPDLTLEHVSLTQAADLRRREVDIAVTWDRPARGPHRIRTLPPPTMRFYATDAYLQQCRAPIRTIEDLKQHRFVSYPSTSHMATSLSQLLSAHGFTLRPQFTSSNVMVQANAAANNGGLVLLPKYIARMHPNLKAVLPELFSIPFPIWLVIHDELAGLARVRAVANLAYRCFAELEHD